MVTMHGFPGRPSRSYPFPGALPPTMTPPAAVNRATWLLADNVRRLVFLRYLTALRAELGYVGVWRFPPRCVLAEGFRRSRSTIAHWCPAWPRNGGTDDRSSGSCRWNPTHVPRSATSTVTMPR